MSLITHDEMVFVINEYLGLPGDAHGRDYLVGMPVDGEVQTGDAFIIEWRLPDVPEPDVSVIKALWQDDAQPYQEQWQARQGRGQRDALLLALDAIVGNPLRWAAFDAAAQMEVAAYRQALLDVPQQAGFPTDVVWPVKPAVLETVLETVN